MLIYYRGGELIPTGSGAAAGAPGLSGTGGVLGFENRGPVVMGLTGGVPAVCGLGVTWRRGPGPCSVRACGAGALAA